MDNDKGGPLLRSRICDKSQKGWVDRVKNESFLRRSNLI